MTKESGIHKDYEQLPEVPPLTERQKEKQKVTSAADGFFGLAEALTTAINLVVPPAEQQKESLGQWQIQKYRKINWFSSGINLRPK